MGYTAKGDGCIAFTHALSETDEQRICDLLEDEFEIYDSQICGSDAMVSFVHHDRYYDDEVYGILNTIANEFPIQSGEVDIIGEDDSMWRSIYNVKTKEWDEQNASIVYETRLLEDGTCSNCGQSLTVNSDLIASTPCHCFKCGYKIITINKQN